MTNLNEGQQELLDRVESVRVGLEPLLEKLREQQAAEMWEAKKAIRDAAREAYEAGVPARKIGFALDTSDHKTIKKYIGKED